ncbi:MAG: hypothetical protein SRB1_02932 [Desulfobacteraceae bacterium Eth-SRB1]|nr:MAG: hypothetical protein SRB1_02932 [Desulfobacteraceae bacterium Eth-SRB1]
MGGDRPQYRSDLHTRVSIHAPAWGATVNGFCFLAGLYEFQSTPPHGGRPTRATLDTLFSVRFQSTPPHGGRHTIAIIVLISIGFNPRPRMGGDMIKRLRSRQSIVSIHAPAWGATLGVGGHFSTMSVSIHAPAWGATASTSMLIFNCGLRFNPRPRMGGDICRRY